MKESAVILCEGYFDRTDGKTTHGLVRYSERYDIKGVIDSTHVGEDAGTILEGKPKGIPFYASLHDAMSKNGKISTMIIGVATEGGVLPESMRGTIKEAMTHRLNIVSGLHTFLSEDREFSELAHQNNVHIIDVRKPPVDHHFFSGKIDEVSAFKIAVLGTDCVIGKRTTAINLTKEMNEHGVKTIFIGTGQTAWMQGAQYSIVFDSILNDYVTGEIEHVVHSAFVNEKPDAIVIEGQGAILHPAYPGGYEIISGAHPDAIIVQHSPKRKFLDGFQYPIPPLKRTIEVLNLLSDGKVAAITLNHEHMNEKEISQTIKEYENEFKIPCFDPLWHGNKKIIEMFLNKLKKK